MMLIAAVGSEKATARPGALDPRVMDLKGQLLLNFFNGCNRFHRWLPSWRS